MADIRQMREHTKTLFDAFMKGLSEDQRKTLVDPHARKFAHYEPLKAIA